MYDNITISCRFHMYVLRLPRHPFGRLCPYDVSEEICVPLSYCLQSIMCTFDILEAIKYEVSTNGFNYVPSERKKQQNFLIIDSTTTIY